MSSSGLAYVAMGLRARYAQPAPNLIHRAIGLRACYALPSTDLSHRAIGLRSCYAMSGTDLDHMVLQNSPRISSLVHEATTGSSSSSSIVSPGTTIARVCGSGTATAYSPNLPTRLLRDVRY
eukprot:627376-Rhodomonas_salina.4